jgi:4a-hydroxytetrahydrobiopterin dehydratase
MALSLLSAEKVQQELRSLSGWKLDNKEIVRTYEFPDFVRAMEFVRQVAEKAEAAGHHPDIDIRYNKVRLALVSHDAGGLTDRDIAMARSLNSLH